MNHLPREILSSYALQALDPDEVQSVKEHLAACQECTQRLAEYDAIADGLLFAVPPKTPPPQLRSRLAASMASGRREAASPRFRFSFLPAALGAALIALLVTTVYLVFQVRYLQQQQAALLKILNQYQSTVALVSQPGISVVPLKTDQLSGNMVISPDGHSGVMYLNGLSPLDPDHSYQVWLIPANGSPESAGTFQVQQNQSFISFPIRSPEPIQDFANMGITIEKLGGSEAPTTKPILLVNL
jgi:anti-sigma-K factor RskA